MNIIEAISKINEGNNIDFKGCIIDDSNKSNYAKRHPSQYYLIGRNWCGKMFIQFLEVNENKKVEFQDAIPVHDNINWVETNELQEL